MVEQGWLCFQSEQQLEYDEELARELFRAAPASAASARVSAAVRATVTSARVSTATGADVEPDAVMTSVGGSGNGVPPDITDT